MSTEPSTNAEPLRADSARVRARMLRAARERLAAGDAELPMNTIAKAAGVGVGTVYRHFPSRQALLEALAVDRFTQLVDAAEQAAAGPDVAAEMARLLRTALDHQLGDPALAAVLAEPAAARPETRELGRALTVAVDRLLHRARDAGEIRPEITADDLRALFCGLQHAVTVSGDADRDRYVEILLRGLRA
ncbi:MULTISPECIES: TetR/AcrR family transcriptional regulator [unclassified Micromonospora]|uniref:TetR/AcrR family transcriptional regulator n=1 Tax=unclassified Micromonospora TaxID=2617518 RepID=UPI0010332C52|nr:MULTISPECIES: TetR/AcrR family transcriptional regulator [unclassified Micromonospora]QKW16788.1 TetR/AcrR family transcriptional regulator [Verrucosispora sp. NA02020]TBL41930.1 TetR/AcrR family transcriptional regulator [Verrucosispora sp. SN26_14.1]